MPTMLDRIRASGGPAAPMPADKAPSFFNSTAGVFSLRGIGSQGGSLQQQQQEEEASVGATCLGVGAVGAPGTTGTTGAAAGGSARSRASYVKGGRITKNKHHATSGNNTTTSSTTSTTGTSTSGPSLESGPVLSSSSSGSSGISSSTSSSPAFSQHLNHSQNQHHNLAHNKHQHRRSFAAAALLSASSSGASSLTNTPTITPTTSTSSTPAIRPLLSVASSRTNSGTSNLGLGLSEVASTSNMPAVEQDKPVLSFWGPDPVPLPSRFARIKRNLIAGHEADLERCWARLINALRTEVEHIEDLGAHLIPSIQFADLDDAAQAMRFGRDLHRYGVGVVRKVVPKPDADAMMRETVQYLDARVGGSGGGSNSNGASRPNSTGPDGRGASKDNSSSSRGSSSSHTNGYGLNGLSHRGHGARGTQSGSMPKQAYHIKPLRQDPTCYDFFWTPAQVRSRAHPNVLRAQRFMMGLWETTPDDRLATRLPITYVDRIRIHGAPGVGGGSSNKNGSDPHGLSNIMPALTTEQPPQSADDWITALQSSAGIIAQVDNGSLERWEPDGYQRGGTYDRVFHGQWEDYDPWECASRVPATMDLYNGYGACTIFRMFQGVLALSTIEPGMIRLMPSPKLATAYYLLRPFFSPRNAAPAVRAGPEWDAYLDPANWRLERDPDTIIHGAVPGHAQRITEHWHPHLYLRSSMITLPTLQPGDYIFWHPDLPYHISSNNPGLKTPSTSDSDVSMLLYLPAAPLTQTNALYLARQRKAFLRGHPGPDFDSSGRGTAVEDPDVRPGEKVIAESGGEAGLQAMGLAPWELLETGSGTPRGDKSRRKHVNGVNGHSHGHVPGQAQSHSHSHSRGHHHGHSGHHKRKHDEDTDMNGGAVQHDHGTRSPSGSTSSSTAEAEVVRVSNMILFPDQSMMGYSV